MRFFLSKISILIFSLSLLSFFFFLPTPSLAKDIPPPSPNVDTSVPDNLHNWTQTVMIEVLSSLSCQLTGIDPTAKTQQCLGIDQKTGKIGFVPAEKDGEIGGAIGVVSSGITMLFNSPIHSGDYIQNLAQNFGITKKSYAQVTGTGFEGLKPLLSLWTAFRNIVYLVFVIVFVVIGLAIMLRVKIDPRTVMTIQNQIPKIIIGILLVTFSYAIAGFLVDFMNVSIYVIGNLIISADPNLSQSLPTQLARETNPFQAAGHVGANGNNAATGLWSLVFSPAKAVGESISNLLLSLLASLNFGIITSIFRGLFGAIFGALAFIIITIALLAALFKLWLRLIFAYVTILMDVVLAPFWIMGSIVPGSPINVSGWLRHLIANLAAFPAVIGMFLLGKVFMDAFGKETSSSYFVPPLIGDRVSPEALGSIIGLGIILMTPNVIDMLKTALKVPKFDAGLAKGFAPGLAAVGKAGQIGLGKLTTQEDEKTGFVTYKKGAAGFLGRYLGTRNQ